MTDVSAETIDTPLVERASVSALLEDLKRDVPDNRVTFGWLVEYWRVHSPEVPIIVLALVGVLPGVSVAIGVLLALLSLAMISQSESVLPAFLAARPLPSARLLQTIDRALPWFRWSERYVRPRDVTLARALRPWAGAVIFALSLTLLVPLPLSNVVPALAIAFVALASIEGDGLLLTVAIGGAFLSLALTSAAVWAALGAAARMWE